MWSSHRRFCSTELWLIIKGWPISSFWGCPIRSQRSKFAVNRWFFHIVFCKYTIIKVFLIIVKLWVCFLLILLADNESLCNLNICEYFNNRTWCHLEYKCLSDWEIKRWLLNARFFSDPQFQITETFQLAISKLSVLAWNIDLKCKSLISIPIHTYASLLPKQMTCWVFHVCIYLKSEA